MEIFGKFMEWLACVPDWVPLVLFPALVLVLAVLLTVFGARKAYVPVSAVLAGAGFAILCASDIAKALCYLGIFVAVIAALSLLFFIPARKFHKKPKKSKADEMYEKFHEELTEKPFRTEQNCPPKVCCFEEQTEHAEESGAQLAYADTLIQKLRAEKLTPADRLEAEELARTLERFRGKPLTEAERGSLNDCLASVLKMTAKYKL